MSGPPKIFRETALERLSTPEQLDRLVRMTPSAGWAVLVLLAMLSAVALVWGAVATVPMRLKAEGILIDREGVLDVVSSSQGRITALEVTSGATVRPGQVVARLDQPELQRDLAAVQAELEEAEAQHRTLTESNARLQQAEADVAEARRAALRQELALLKERRRWLEERQRYELDFVAKGTMTRQRAFDTQIDLNTVHNDTAQAENELRQIDLTERTTRVERQREASLRELRLGDLRRRGETLALALARQGVVTSSSSGTIVELKVGVGDVVERGTSLASVLPEGSSRANLVAVLFAPPDEGKKIVPGMDVQLALSTVKAAEFGYVEGRVERVAAIPATAEGMTRLFKNRQLVDRLSGRGAPLEVVVALTHDPATPSGFRWTSMPGPDVVPGAGTLCSGFVTVRQVRLLSALIPDVERLLKGWGL